MAEFNSLNESGFLQSPRIPASVSFQQKEAMFLLQDDRDPNWTGEGSRQEYKLIKRTKQHEYQPSTGSEKSGLDTGSSHSLSTSGRLPNSSLDAMNSNSPSGLPHPGKLTGVVTESLDGQAARNSQMEVVVTPFTAENPRISVPHRSTPMERFLIYDGSASGIHDIDTVAIREEKRRLRSLRTSSLRLRSQLRTKRIELREKQLAKNAADESFIRYTRENKLTMGNESSPIEGPDPLNTYYTAMQHVRDEYGPLEDDYSRLEDILDQTEFEMAKIEARLYGPESPQEFENANIISPLEEYSDSLLLGLNSLLGLSTEVHENYQPIHRELLSRLGDLDLAKERYENMRQERESLSMEQESRARFGLELHENLKMLLAELPTQEELVKGEIAEIEVDVERLRAECLAAGIDLDLSDAGSGIMTDMEFDTNNALTTET
ncbi:hypothetical protein N431DRAFT_471370 [Stipitochalara longipes BDJ]|nr:hypothetical protein N431DRAFT_471370 [Stipitochalara longipes BDJ]